MCQISLIKNKMTTDNSHQARVFLRILTLIGMGFFVLGKIGNLMVIWININDTPCLRVKEGVNLIYEVVSALNMIILQWFLYDDKLTIFVDCRIIILLCICLLLEYWRFSLVPNYKFSDDLCCYVFLNNNWLGRYILNMIGQ